ncbi:MAG: M48 family metallopeptidase [Gammaproteobacteria bacterium]|nr:M48 family metallopeptidase [Gammaproteobacteria bacterium]
MASIFFKSSVFFLFAGCTIASLPPAVPQAELEAEVESQRALAAQTLRDNTQHIADLSWPIVANNAALCANFVEYRSGLWIAHEQHVPTSWFDSRDESKLRIGEEAEIWGIAKDSPAATTVLAVGDRILSIADEVVSNSKRARGVLSKALAASEGKPIALRAARGKQTIEVELGSVATCRSKIRVTSRSSINAKANGRTITINNGLIDFARNDEELQFVIAHELAHNVASHVPKARAGAGIGLVFDIALAGYGRVWAGGVFSYLGARAMSKKYEREADYLAMYYLANANVDLNGIESFWRRMASMDASSTGFALTHPSTPERFVMMRMTRDEIEEKRVNGEGLVPESK